MEDVARFVAWLRAPAGNVIVLADGNGTPGAGDGEPVIWPGCSASMTIMPAPACGVAGELVAWRRVSRGSYKPFLHHVTKGRPGPGRGR